MHFIEPHYLLALAFVILGKAGITGGELSTFHSRLQKAMKEKHIRALFLFGSKDFEKTMLTYPDCFGELNDGLFYLCLADKEELVRRFLAYLSNDVLKAACDEFGYTGN